MFQINYLQAMNSQMNTNTTERKLSKIHDTTHVLIEPIKLMVVATS